MAKATQGRITGKVMTTRIRSPAGGVRIETFIPWTLIKRGVRREVITPTDAPKAFQYEVRTANERRKREQHSPLLRALGLAHYWQQLLDERTFRSITEIAVAEGMDVGRVSRIMRLAQLSPAVTSAMVALTSDGIAPGIAIRCSIPLEWHLQPAADPGSCR